MAWQTAFRAAGFSQIRQRERRVLQEGEQRFVGKEVFGALLPEMLHCQIS